MLSNRFHIMPEKTFATPIQVRPRRPVGTGVQGRQWAPAPAGARRAPGPAAVAPWLLALAVMLSCLASPADCLAGPARAAATDNGAAMLLDVQRQVQRAMERAMAATVAVEVADGSGSGVIVSADGLVLTAGHVSMTPGTELTVVFSTGKKVAAEALGRAPLTDAGMARITEQGPWPFVDMADGQTVIEPGDWCFALGHPQGFELPRGAVVRVGRILARARNTIQSDCTLLQGDSGGPLFNLAGEVIGIHSRIASASSRNFHVPVTSFERDWNRMRRGEQSLVPGRGRGGWIGLASRDYRGEGGGVEITAQAEGSPAAEAGLQRGDVIRSIDGVEVTDRADFSREIAHHVAGDEVEIEFIRDGEIHTLRVTLGHQPGTR